MFLWLSRSAGAPAEKEGRKKSPCPGDRGFGARDRGGGRDQPQLPEAQEPELQPPPPTGLAEVMEKPER